MKVSQWFARWSVEHPFAVFGAFAVTVATAVAR